MLGGYHPIRKDSGGLGFQPVPAQAKACGYIYINYYVPISVKFLLDPAAPSPH